MGWRVRLAVAAAFWCAGLVAGLLSLGHIPAGPGTGPDSPALWQPDATFGHLLFTNLTVLAICLTGLLTAGTAAAVQLAVSGYFLGLLLATARAAGATAGQLARAVLPHGLPEVLGLWLAGAAGLSGLPLLALVGRPGSGKARAGLMRCLVWQAAAAVALTVLAAWLEWCVTPVVMARGG